MDDHFERLKEEVSKLSNVMQRLEEERESARGIPPSFDARRALDRAAAEAEIAAYWANKCLDSMLKMKGK